MSLIINISSIIIIFASMFFYYRKVILSKNSVVVQKALSNTSQLTMSAYLLGLAIILIELNAFGLSRSKFVTHLLMYGAFVSLVNSLSLWYFSRTLKAD
ncbi:MULTISPECIES: hypothetical protein [Vagococcus]|uniref:Integral membrane protein n=1 Tax=Vagococcus fluvialis bH819 TaxID=1255619 RepID=A0A1X6WLQ6_9ENTE|nr:MULTISPECIES: hypothetical protein [Vagococcus]SLM85207.1 hypothetical protein FM121_03850 [Vagococcus fluvialis bH819]HCM88380.1 hypothetical protein [Vagococcus sp.]